MKSRGMLTFTTVIISCLLAGSLLAANVPLKVAYQAVLSSAGSPVTTPVNVTFTIYDAAAKDASAAVWSETRMVSPDAAGRISVLLGETSAISETAFNGSERWLGIQIESDPEMTPRMPMASSAYSFKVETIDGAKGGELKGGLTLQEAAKGAFAASDAQIILVSLNGDSAIFNPVSMQLIDNLGVDQISLRTDPSTGGFLGIRMDGTESAEHQAVSSAWYQNDAAKGPQAFSKKMEIGYAGMSLFGDSDTDTLIAMSESSPGLPEIVLTDRSAAKDFTAAANRKLRIGGFSAAGDVLLSLEDAAGNKLMETYVDGAGDVRQVFYEPAAKGVSLTGAKRMEVSREGVTIYDDAGNVRVGVGLDVAGQGRINFYEGAAKSVAAATNKVSLSKDGLAMFGATESDTLLCILPNGDICGQGSLTMGKVLGAAGLTSYIMGDENTVTGDSAVCLGVRNTVTHWGGAVLSGAGNTVTRDGTVITGGIGNSANGIHAFLGAGKNNTADGSWGVTGGGESNSCNGAMGYHRGRLRQPQRRKPQRYCWRPQQQHLQQHQCHRRR